MLQGMVDPGVRSTDYLTGYPGPAGYSPGDSPVSHAIEIYVRQSEKHVQVSVILVRLRVSLL